MDFNMASYNRLPQGNYNNSQSPQTTSGGQGFSNYAAQYDNNSGQLASGQQASPDGVNTDAIPKSGGGGGMVSGLVDSFTNLGDKLHNNTMRSIQLFTDIDRQRRQDKIAEKDRLLNIQQNNLNNQRQGQLLDANLAQQNANLKGSNLDRQIKDYQFRQAIKQGNAGTDIGRWVALGMVGGLKEVKGA